MSNYTFGRGKWVFIDWIGVEPGYGANWDSDSANRLPSPVGVKLKVHHPRFDPTPVIAPDRPWETMGLSPYATFLPDQGRFRCWYESHHGSDGKFEGGGVAYAESDNGVDWKKPTLRLGDFKGSRENNYIHGGPGHGAGVFIDPHGAPAERYKAVWCHWAMNDPNDRHVKGAVSRDGLEWNTLPEPVLPNQNADTQNIATFDPDLEKYVLYTRQTDPIAGAYAYAKYHTLTFTSEVLWAPSALVRHRRLLRVGREVWPGEYYPGYPTRVVIWQNSDLLTAYGQTAAARRRSRVELWTKLPQLRFGFVNPEMEGLKFNVCTTTSSAAKELGSNPQTQTLAERIRAHPRMNGDYLLRLLARYPDYAGQWGKTANLCLTGGGPADPKESPIEHGLAPRLRIGFPAARISDVRVNGFPVGVSESNGYLTWTARAFTYVQVNIPPEESRRHDVFIITCEYESGVRRVRGEW